MSDYNIVIIGKSGSSYIPAFGGTVRFRRSVQYLRFPSQKKFDELTGRYRGFSGPIGSGKSLALVMHAIKCAYLNPHCVGLVGAPTYKILTDSTLTEMLSTLEAKQIPYDFKKGNYQIDVLEPKSSILLRTMDEPERLRAMNLAWFGVDELTYCKEAAWTRLEGRLRDPRAKHKCGFAVWTPKGRDWVWKKFISARRVKIYECIQAQPFENRAVLNATPDYYANLKESYDEKFYRQEVLGEYLDMFSGAAYHGFNSDLNVRECVYDPSLPLVVAMDFNVNPMSGVLCQQHSFYGKRTVQVLKEIVLPSSHTSAWIEQLLRIIEPWVDARWRSGAPLQLKVYGDASGAQRQSAAGGESNWSIVEKMLLAQQPRIQYIPSYKTKNPSHLDRVNAVNAMLCTFGESYKTAGERRVAIDPQCRELIMDLEEISWKVDAAGNSYPEIDKTDPKRTHCSDAWGYYMEAEFSLNATAKASTKFIT